MRLLGQFQTFYFFFFMIRFYTQKNNTRYQKAQKGQKHNQAKAYNTNKRTKIKNALKKHLSGKKSLICLFAKKKASTIETLISLN